MATRLTQDFLDAVARWLRTKVQDDVRVVTGWDEYLPRYDTGCDTCGWGAPDTEVSIYYTTADGGSHRYVYYGEFGQLLTELLNA